MYPYNVSDSPDQNCKMVVLSLIFRFIFTLTCMLNIIYFFLYNNRLTTSKIIVHFILNKCYIKIIYSTNIRNSSYIYAFEKHIPDVFYSYNTIYYINDVIAFVHIFCKRVIYEPNCLGPNNILPM